MTKNNGAVAITTPKTSRPSENGESGRCFCVIIYLQEKNTGKQVYYTTMRNGTKIEANANRYTFIWAKAVKKQLEKLDVRISKEVPEIALR